MKAGEFLLAQYMGLRARAKTCSHLTPISVNLFLREPLVIMKQRQLESRLIGLSYVELRVLCHINHKAAPNRSMKKIIIPHSETVGIVGAALI